MTLRLSHPPPGAQGTDPPSPLNTPEEGRRTRAAALRLTAEEAQRVRTAIRKVARAVGGFKLLAAKLDVPTNTLYHAANPRGSPSAALAIRLAAVAQVPVGALLTGKLAVAPAVIGVAA